MRKAALLFCLLAACALACPRAMAQEPELPAELYGLELKWYVHFDGYNDPGYAQGNPTSDWIRDILGVKVTYVSSGNQAEKTLAKMLATGDMPDVITMARGPQLDHLIAQGWVVPLDSYYWQYPNFRKWMDVSALKALCSTVDGKWYAFPSWYTDDEHALGNAGWIVNRKIYNELGRPPIETTDDLLVYLRNVKAIYPEMKPYSPGVTMAVMYTSFGDERAYTLALSGMWCDGRGIRPLCEDPAWRDMALFLNRLNSEGLLATDEYYLSYQQLNEKLSNGQIAVTATSDALNGIMKHDAAYRLLDPNGGYEVIYPPVAKGVTRPTPAAYEYAGGQTVTVITTMAAQPKLAYAYLDWLAGDTGCAVTTCGPPSLYWNELIDFMGAQIPDTNTDAYLNRDTAQWLHDTSSVNCNYVPNGAWSYIESIYRDSLKPIAEGAWDNQSYAKITRSTAIQTDQYAEIEPSYGVEGYDDFIAIRNCIYDLTLEAILSPTETECRKILDDMNDRVNELGAEELFDGITRKWLARRARLGYAD